MKIPNTEYNTLELPLYSVNGIDQPQTSNVRARVADREVVALVDSGASHNFVLKTLIKELGLVVDESVFWSKSQTWMPRVVLRVDLGQCQIHNEGYMFELGGIDLFVEVDWLRTLGDVLLN